MAGQDPAEVLDPQVPLEHRLDEIADRRGDRDHEPEREAGADALGRPGVEQRADEAAQHHRRDRAGDETLEGLVG